MDARYRFEVYPRTNWLNKQRWFLRLVAGNGEVVMTGESNGYHNKADAESMAMHLRVVIPSSKVKVLDK